MATTFETFRGSVYPWHCDQMGHMNVQHYVGMYDQAGYHMLSMVGFTRDLLEEMGAGFADVRHVIEYKAELRAGALVKMESRVLAVGGKSLTTAHRLLDAETDEEAATFEVVTVLFDLVARKSLPIPDAVRAKAEALIAAAPGT